MSRRLFACMLVALAATQAAGKELSDVKPLTSVSAGSYSFKATQSMAFWLDLAPGTYAFTLTSLNETGQANLSHVWLSTGYDAAWNGPNDFATFDVSGNAPYAPFAPVTHTFSGTTSARVYLDLQGANLNKGYAGTLTVTAVPEPASGAMLLAGLGLMGAMVRRRKLQD